MSDLVITIDRDLCEGCEQCVDTCLEGAIQMVDGKAMVVDENHCDGLGRCLPGCPSGAISFKSRETGESFTQAEVAGSEEQPAASSASPSTPSPAHGGSKHLEATSHCSTGSTGGGCPGSQARSLKAESKSEPTRETTTSSSGAEGTGSTLENWPVQIQLMSPRAQSLNNADLLIAADCAAFACGDFHERFMKGRTTLIGCPKLDHADYANKLTQILMENDIRSIVLVKMEVPCCSGLERSVRMALDASGKLIPTAFVTLSLDGKVLA